jgi:hypothetical protein
MLVRNFCVPGFGGLSASILCKNAKSLTTQQKIYKDAG